MSNFSLKDSIDVSPQRVTEYLDAVRDAKKGKKGAIERLEKCVDDGMITATAYEDLCNKYKNARLIKRIIPSVILCVAVLVVCAIYIINALAHSGRTDANGGHWDRSTGTYHYHTGEYAGKSSSSSYSDKHLIDYEDSYDYGHKKGYEDGYEDGKSGGYNTGYNEGYTEGYHKGYEEGYEGRIKEAAAERKKEYRFLLILIIAIVLIVQIVKLIKKHRDN